MMRSLRALVCTMGAVICFCYASTLATNHLAFKWLVVASIILVIIAMYQILQGSKEAHDKQKTRQVEDRSE